MCFSHYDSWVDDEGHPVSTRETRETRHVSTRRRFSTSNSTKVHFLLPPTPEPQPRVQEVCFVPTYIPVPAPAPVCEQTFSIEATAAEIASRIVAENIAREEITTLQARLEEEQALRIRAEHERGREEARRITREIDEDRRSRELIKEDNARRRIADEYRHHTRSLGNSPRTSGESLWSTSPRASSSNTDRLVVVTHHSHQRSLSDSRNHRCSNCGHSGHRSRDCRHVSESIARVAGGRVRYIDSGL